MSDSGISDGGCVSDGGLSEREKRLGALRRLARQLENALAPGSEALKSISQRMEAAEAELRSLQDTCRELIVRTATGQQQQQTVIESHAQSNGGRNTSGVTVPTIVVSNGKGKLKRSPPRLVNINDLIIIVESTSFLRICMYMDVEMNLNFFWI